MLPDAIGRAMANDVLTSKEETGFFEGKGIRIDKTGMAEFYDKMLVRLMNKFGKPWRSTVSDAEVMTKDVPSAWSEEYPTRGEPEPATWETVHSMPITPEMQESIIALGMPFLGTEKEGTGAKTLLGFFEAIEKEQTVKLKAKLKQLTGGTQITAGVDLSILSPIVTIGAVKIAKLVISGVHQSSELYSRWRDAMAKDLPGFMSQATANLKELFNLSLLRAIRTTPTLDVEGKRVSYSDVAQVADLAETTVEEQVKAFEDGGFEVVRDDPLLPGVEMPTEAAETKVAEAPFALTGEAATRTPVEPGLFEQMQEDAEETMAEAMKRLGDPTRLHALVDPTEAAKILLALTQWSVGYLGARFQETGKYLSESEFMQVLREEWGDLLEQLSDYENEIAALYKDALGKATMDRPSAGPAVSETQTLLDLAEAQRTGEDKRTGEEQRREMIQPLELPEMISLVRELLGRPDKEIIAIVKRLRGKAGTLGTFSPKRQRITLLADLFETGKEPGQAIELARVLAHEIGHVVDWLEEGQLSRGNLIGRLRKLKNHMKGTFVSQEGTIITNAELRKELIEFSAKWRPWPDNPSPAYKRYRNSAVELYADAISGILVNPGVFSTYAPKFYRQFFKELKAAPEIERAFFDIQALLGGIREDMLDAVNINIVRGYRRSFEVIMEASEAMAARVKAMQWDVWTWMRVAFVDNNAAMIDRIVKTMKRLGRHAVSEDFDIRHLLSARSYIGSITKAFSDEYFQPILTALVKSTLNDNRFGHHAWEVFGMALEFERMTEGDRGGIANPHGLSGARAQEQYDHMIETFRRGPDGEFIPMTKEEQVFLREQIQLLRTAVNTVTEKAHQAGLYSDEMYEQMMANPAYATFRVVEHMDKALDARVHHQVGTIQAVANPADSTMMKTLLVLQAVERQKIKSAGLRFLNKFFADEVKAAPISTVNGVPVPQPPTSPLDKVTWGLVKYYEKGKVKGVWVDLYVAQSLNNDSIGHQNAAIKILEKMNNTWFRPMFTTANLGFQGYNLIRDFFRFWKAMSHRGLRGGKRRSVSVFKAVRLYWGARTVGRVRAYGLPTEGRRRAFGLLKKGKPPTERQLAAFEELQGSYQGRILSATMANIGRGFEPGAGNIQDAEMERLLKQGGMLSPEPEKRSIIPRAIVGYANWVSSIGDFVETLPKAAAIHHFTVDRSIADLTEQERAFIRERVGSPDFLAGGTWKPLTNNLFLFSNAIIQGWRSDIKTMTESETRSGYLWKTARMTVLPKVMMMAATLGWWGKADDDDEEMWDKLKDAGFWGTVGATVGGVPGLIAGGIFGVAAGDMRPVDRYKKQLSDFMRSVPAYAKTNFFIIPMMRTDTGEVMHLRLPQDDTGRVIGAITWNMLRGGLMAGDIEVWKTVQAVAAYTSGQVPTAIPVFGFLADVTAVLKGENPYDPFRQRGVFSREEMLLQEGYGRWKRLKTLISYEFRQMGFGQIMSKARWFSKPSEGPDAPGVLQRIFEAPLAYNVLGRFVRFSSYGEEEATDREAQIANAPVVERRNRIRDEITVALKNVLETSLNQREGAIFNQLDEAISRLEEEAPDLFSDGMLAAQRNSMERALRERIALNTGEHQHFFRAFDSLARNSLKVGYLHRMVDAARKRGTEEEFDVFYRALQGTTLLSEDVMESFNRRRNEPFESIGRRSGDPQP